MGRGAGAEHGGETTESGLKSAEEVLAWVQNIRGRDGRALDLEVRDLVAGLHRHGVATLGSGQGRLKAPWAAGVSPVLIEAPYVTIAQSGSERMRDLLRGLVWELPGWHLAEAPDQGLDLLPGWARAAGRADMWRVAPGCDEAALSLAHSQLRAAGLRLLSDETL